MSLRSFFAGLWPFKPSAERQLQKLLQQIEAARDDLKIRIAESIANESALQKKLAEEPAAADSSLAGSVLSSALAAEQKIGASLKEIFNDLGSRKAEIELVYEQNLARKRKASTNELLASLYQDFGSELKLNNYLEKFSSEALKIEYTAESNLKIEMLLKKTGQ